MPGTRLFLFVVFLTGLTAFAAPDQFSLGWWNVENLFDAVDDPTDHDDRIMKDWDQERYELKIKHLADVIKELDDGKTPDVIGLCEIENRAVLEDLVKAIGGKPYTIVHEEGTDHRSIEVAILTRYPVTSSRSILVYEGTRSHLQVELNVNGKALHLIAGHWKSRYGGKERTAPLRLLCAKFAKDAADDIMEKDPDADVIIFGDFNDDNTDESVVRGLDAVADLAAVKARKHAFYNVTSTGITDDAPGTYNYKGTWDTLDQYVFSPGLLDQKGLGYVDASFRIVTLDGKLIRNGYPFRFQPYNVQDFGYSDHLPLVARFRIYR
jgi:endonuclease/exonuclease/phosphatase family metal-dependent hydrolase